MADKGEEGNQTGRNGQDSYESRTSYDNAESLCGSRPCPPECSCNCHKGQNVSKGSQLGVCKICFDWRRNVLENTTNPIKATCILGAQTGSITSVTDVETVSSSAISYQIKDGSGSTRNTTGTATCISDRNSKSSQEEGLFEEGSPRQTDKIELGNVMSSISSDVTPSKEAQFNAEQSQMDNDDVSINTSSISVAKLSVSFNNSGSPGKNNKSAQTELSGAYLPVPKSNDSKDTTVIVEREVYKDKIVQTDYTCFGADSSRRLTLESKGFCDEENEDVSVSAVASGLLEVAGGGGGDNFANLTDQSLDDTESREINTDKEKTMLNTTAKLELSQELSVRSQSYDPSMENAEGGGDVWGDLSAVKSQTGGDPFPDSAKCNVRFEWKYEGCDKREQTNVGDVVMYKWLYIQDSLESILPKQMFLIRCDSHFEGGQHIIVIEGNLPMERKSAESFIATMKRRVQDLIGSVKEVKIKNIHEHMNDAKAVLVYKKLTSQLKGDGVSVIFSKAKRHILLLSNDSRALTQASNYVKSVLAGKVGGVQKAAHQSEKEGAQTEEYDMPGTSAYLQEKSVTAPDTINEDFKNCEDPGIGMPTSGATSSSKASQIPFGGYSEEQSTFASASVELGQHATPCFGDTPGRTAVVTGTAKEDCQQSKLPLTKLEAKFLQGNNILLVFLKKMMSEKIFVDTDSLSNNCIIFEGNAEKLKAALNDMMYTDSFSADKDDKDMRMILSRLTEKFGEKVLVDLDNGILTLIFLCEVPESERKDWIESLKVCVREYPMPNYILHYFQLHATSFANAFLEGKKVRVCFQPDQGVLQTKTDRSHHHEVECELQLQELLAKLFCKQISVDFTTGCFLLSHEGEKELSKVEKTKKVSVHIEVPGHDMLLKTRSNKEHQVQVCRGTLVDTENHVTILPLHTGQKEWSPLCRSILTKGLLSTDTTQYLQSANSNTLTLDCQGVPKGSHVVVLCVPPSDSGKFKSGFHAAVSEALESALSKHQGTTDLNIAICLKEKEWKLVLFPVIETLKGVTGRRVTVQMYFDQTISSDTKVAKVVLEMAKYFKDCNSKTGAGWVVDTYCGLKPSVKNKVQVIAADIFEQKILDQTDVLVNSTDRKLSHSAAAVSKGILERAGPGLTTECNNKFPKGIGEHLVAVTGSHKLHHVKEIFHIVLPVLSWEKCQDKEDRLEELRNRVLCCLALASFKRHQSITFPSLGTGKALKYPADEVAGTMITAAEDFFAYMPDSSLEQINIVCFHEDTRVIQAFSKLLNSPSAKEVPESKGKKPRRRGKSDKQNAAPPSTRKAVIHICGNTTAVKEAAEEIQKIAVPKDYQPMLYLVSENDASSVVEAGNEEVSSGEDDNTFEKKSVRTQEVSNQDWCYFTVPETLFAAKHMIALEKSDVIGEFVEEMLTVEEQIRGEKARCKKFLVKTSHLGQVVTHVMEMLSIPEPEMETRHAPSSLQRRKQLPSLPEKKQTHPWRRQIHHHDLLALASLIGLEFEEMFTVRGKTGELLDIECNESAPPQHLVHKMDTLRHEEMHIPGGDLSQFRDSFDTKSEGVDAFVLTVPHERKVIIFSFEYNNLSKAKHLVNVRLGKVKVTTRGKRRFDGASLEPEGSLIDQSQSNLLRPPDGASSEFKTKTGIMVSVYKTDITKLPVDAIVNAANEHLNHGGGVAYAISRAAGFELEEEGDAYIREHGPLKVTEVAITTAGSLPCKKVLHAVGPRWGDYADKSICQGHLIQAVFNCMKTASDQGFKSLAISSISSAIFGVPQEVCAQSYLSAVQKFDDQLGGRTSLVNIHFVDIIDGMVSIIKDTFTSMWNSPISLLTPTGNGSRGSRDLPEAGQGQLKPPEQLVQHAVKETVKTGNDPNYVASAVSQSTTRFNQRTEKENASTTGSSEGATQVGCSAAGASHNASTYKATYTTSVQGDTVSSYVEPGMTIHLNEKRPSGQTSMNVQGSHEQHKRDTRDGSEVSSRLGAASYMKSEENNNMYQFCYSGIEVIFQKNDITCVAADCLVLWQQFSKLLEDEHSNKIMQRTGASVGAGFWSKTKETLKKDQVAPVHLQDQLLVFKTVFASDVQDQKKIGTLLDTVLTTADMEEMKTVAIPPIPSERAMTSKHVDIFATCFFAALKKYLDTSKRCIRKVYIVSDIVEYLKAVADSVSQVAAIELSKQEANKSSANIHGRSVTDHPQRSHRENCAVCLQPPKDTMVLHCGHIFCRGCIDRCFASKKVCPVCKKRYGIDQGDQPTDGKMKMFRRSSYSLPGFSNTETLVVEYDFPSGKQGPEHPKQGQEYKGIDRKAYLPNTPEGRQVLMLLKTAFERRLTFTIGTSNTTGQEGIVWNGIHHKTNKSSQGEYRYPDATYLTRVKDELAAVGVTEKDFNDAQREFVQNPTSFWTIGNFQDFSANLKKVPKGH